MACACAVPESAMALATVATMAIVFLMGFLLAPSFAPETMHVPATDREHWPCGLIACRETHGPGFSGSQSANPKARGIFRNPRKWAAATQFRLKRIFAMARCVAR